MDHALTPPRSVEGPLFFQNAVARAVEYIHAGDIFQVNLAHRIAAEFSGSARSLFVRALQRSSPRYGAYLEIEDHAEQHNAHFALSLSPELFLQFDPATRTLITRPIKGTLHSGHAADALRESVKNQAELNMIIDLMRNDLGRVAEIGSVRVDDARTIETHAVAAGEHRPTHSPALHHGALHHGVGTVSCQVRPGITITDILRATFPAGSITGAPKVRAMQVINELHGRLRGLYTGAIGYVSDSGHFAFNVAIRTAMILDQRDRKRRRSSPIDECDQAAVLVPVGAGIVADSDPRAEWQETLDKARVFTDLADEQSATTHTHPP
ncbi:MAG: anthranilate synthase component I family protein [Phycisphaerales bacterium]|nr:anthranilate synthase component I family protein [Phycisphaerales bacterium]